MSGAYLPVTREVRDRANAYLAGMAARGFVPMPMDEVVRRAEAAERQRQSCQHDYHPANSGPIWARLYVCTRCGDEYEKDVS